MIEVKHLTKRYGAFEAVSDLSFTITPGQIYGFLGPNGAGKSTTMNIMTGCLAATSGEVKIGGYDIFEQPREAKRLVGYLPERPPLYMEQTVYEYLHFVARAKGLRSRDMEPEIQRAIEQTHIEEVSEKLIKHLSKGYCQRVGIAQALIGNPEIIILDEPTVGLDPAQIIEMRALIKDLGENHTVIISSHILSEIQAVCDQVLIIHKGRLVAFDRLENLSRVLSSGNTVELCCEVSPQRLRELIGHIPGISDLKLIEQTDTSCTATLHVGEEDPKQICRQIFLAFAAGGEVLQQLNPVQATLEDIFIQITTEKEEPEEAEEVREPEEAGQEQTPPSEEEAEPAGEPEEAEPAGEPEEPEGNKEVDG